MSATTIGKQDLWSKRIANYRSSGMTAKLWCEKEGYKIHTLRYWIRKINAQSSSARVRTDGFLELTMTKPITPEVSREIKLSYKSYHLDVPKDYDEDILIRLLGTLKRC